MQPANARPPAWTSVLATLPTTLLALAGCVSEPTVSPLAEDLPGSGPAATASAQGMESEAVEAPGWQIGQWLQVEEGHTQGQPHFEWTSVVVADDGDQWTLAADQDLIAAMEAAFDTLLVGAFSKKDLGSTNIFETGLFRFPLTDGASWDSTFNLGETMYSFTSKATWQDSIQTAKGPRPGFQIHASLEDGFPLYDYDFIPEIGYYATMIRYDLFQPPGTVLFRHDVVDWGTNFTGTTYTAQAQPLISHFYSASAEEPTWSIPPNPVGGFDVPLEAQRLLGYLVAVAHTGAQATILIDPNHAAHSAQAVAPPMQQEANVQMWWQDALPGHWDVATLGAGAIAIGIVDFWAVTLHESNQ